MRLHNEVLTQTHCQQSSLGWLQRRRLIANFQTRV